jgi:RIO kinase 1
LNYRNFNSATSDNDDFEDFEEQFNSLNTDRKARRARKPRVKPAERKTEYQIASKLADDAAEGLEGGLTISYHPSKYESGWLLDSLRHFYDEAHITDVLALVRGGKEASVYRCVAHPSTNAELLAAKVYRPRMFRQLRNDQMYREGRHVLTAEGRTVKKTDHRTMRALGKKTAFGEQVAHTSWLMYEYQTLRRLHQIGAAVPRPVAMAENAILMGYVGDRNIAAPTLSEVTLESDEVEPLFRETLRNVELMLQNNLIHGDLSAYNILYWEGEITLIDFPQVTDTLSNRNAYPIMRRDITRICEYFARQGLERDPAKIMNDLWGRYVKTQPGKLMWDDIDLSDGTEDL